MSEFSLFVRSFVFNIFIYVWCLVFCVLFLPFLLFPLNAIRKISHIWAGTVLAFAKIVIKLNFEVRGMHNIPTDTPVIFASKHQSSWEIFAFPFLIDNITAFVKKELIYIPILGLFLKKFKTISVDRNNPKKNWLDIALDNVNNGTSILIFPEGTRVGINEAKIYKSGVYRLYEASSVPVIPVALNSGIFWPRRRFIKRPGKVIIEFLPMIKSGLNKDEFMKTLNHNVEEKTKKLIDEACGCE